MYAARDLIFITSNYIYSKLLMIAFSNYCCLFKAAFYWKIILLKYYITVLFRQFMRTFTQFLYLPGANENLKIYVLIWFEQMIGLKHFWGTFLRHILLQNIPLYSYVPPVTVFYIMYIVVYYLMIIWINGHPSRPQQSEAKVNTSVDTWPKLNVCKIYLW